MLCFAIISKLVWLSEPYIFGKIINTIQLEWKDWFSAIIKLLLLYSSLTFLWWIFHGFSRIREENIKFATNKAFTSDLFEKITALPMEWQSDNHSGKTIDKVTKATSALKEFAGNTHMHFYTLVTWIWSCLSLFFIRRPAGVIVSCLFVCAVFMVNRFDQTLNTYLNQKNEKEHDVMSNLFDFLSNIKTVITLRFQNRALQTVRKRIQEVYPVFRKFTILNEWKWFSMDSLNTTFIFALVSFYIYTQFETQGVVLIGSITMLWQYTERMKSAFEHFTWLYGWLMQMSTNLHCIDGITDAYDALDKQEEQIIFDKQHPFHLQDLRFSYVNNGVRNQVLKDISLDLIPGERIALVGSSGSGKSTLMMLLRWLYAVDQVTLTIDNQQFSTLEPLSHYASLIPQDPEIFEQTIRYNITMWLDVDDETVMQMCELARFSEVLTTLPHGLDTDIKEKWVNLSGWQKQRLALARWLLMATESRLLLLDESTSSVDVHNEKLIYTQIFDTFTSTCIVASIHKLHLLPLFDRIYVIDQWTVHEEWTLEELLKNPSWHLYKLRWAYQSMIEE